MATIVISRTAADGTLVDGDTEKGDGTGDILKRHGFRWFRSLRQYGIPQSRDRAPRVLAIEAAADKLREAGHTVDVEIDGEVRDNVTVNAAKHERLEDRREALAVKGDKLTREAAGLMRASDVMVEHLPLGQPVMPGPRGRAHRNLLERSVTTAIRSAQTADAARQVPARIEGSRRAEAYKERPDVTARRVERLEAEERSLQRRMAGLALYPSANSDRLRRQYEGEIAVLKERIARDRAVLDAAREAGTFRPVLQGQRAPRRPGQDPGQVAHGRPRQRQERERDDGFLLDGPLRLGRGQGRDLPPRPGHPGQLTRTPGRMVPGHSPPGLFRTTSDSPRGHPLSGRCPPCPTSGNAPVRTPPTPGVRTASADTVRLAHPDTARSPARPRLPLCTSVLETLATLPSWPRVDGARDEIFGSSAWRVRPSKVKRGSVRTCSNSSSLRPRSSEPK
ncbi:DUF3560 domain-containing protein [Streptomyces zaomyceticus]|uniref:DUF3560 domain-containing protein n=1 Tax=Streptomyces zaomyceticus TaxID=68286 RepID=UPI0036463EBB